MTALWVVQQQEVSVNLYPVMVSLLKWNSFFNGKCK